MLQFSMGLVARGEPTLAFDLRPLPLCQLHGCYVVASTVPQRRAVARASDPTGRLGLARCLSLDRRISIRHAMAPDGKRKRRQRRPYSGVLHHAASWHRHCSQSLQSLQSLQGIDWMKKGQRRETVLCKFCNDCRLESSNVSGYLPGQSRCRWVRDQFGASPSLSFCR